MNGVNYKADSTRYDTSVNWNRISHKLLPHTGLSIDQPNLQHPRSPYMMIPHTISNSQKQLLRGLDT